MSLISYTVYLTVQTRPAPGVINTASVRCQVKDKVENAQQFESVLAYAAKLISDSSDWKQHNNGVCLIQDLCILFFNQFYGDLPSRK